jgi:hypothetical protein
MLVKPCRRDGEAAYQAGGLALGMQGIGGDHLSGEVQRIEQGLGLRPHESVLKTPARRSPSR